MKKTVSSHEGEISQHNLNFSLNENKFSLLFSQFEKIMVDCESLRNNKVEKDAYVEDVKSICSSIRDAELKIDENYNHLLTVENYVEKYSPMRTQTQISEVLRACLGKANVRRLICFEKEKYEELHNVILKDEGNADVQRQIKSIADKAVGVRMAEIIEEIKNNHK